LGHAFDQAFFAYLIGDLGDDDGLTIFVESFDAGFGAHHEATASGLVGFVDSGFAVNDSVRREVGSFDDV